MELKKDTICVQGGWQPKNGEPRVLPIIRALRSAMRQAKRWENCLIWRKKGYFYSRLQNPTCDIVAQKSVILRGRGSYAYFFRSGSYDACGD